MIQKLSSYWRHGTIYCSLELTTQMGQERVYGITAKNKKDSFDDIVFFEENAIEKTATHISKNQHCFLTISTDNVLIEQVRYFEKEEDIISQAFPNLSNDFYTEILKQGEIAFVAISRKEYVNTKIKALEKQGLSIVGFTLGFTSLPNVLLFIENKIIAITNQEVTISKRLITSFNSFENSTNRYSIEGVSVSSNHLLSIAALPSYFKKESSGNDAEKENVALKNRHKKRIFFQKGLYLGIGILVAIWIINLFLYNSYKNQIRDIRSASSISATQKETYQETLKEVNQKERLVQNIIQVRGSKSIFYINRITTSLPESIRLAILEYQPVDKAIRLAKEIIYLENTILISGTSYSDTGFNQWISKLEAFQWLQRITVTNYSQQSNSKIDFELKIVVKDDTAN